MKKLAGLLVLCAFLAPASAHAGSRSGGYEVIVNPQGKFALGSLGTVRNSRDKVQGIGCAFRGGGGSAGSCWARDAAGVYGTCHFFDSPDMTAALTMVNGDSHIRFEWNDAGYCISISVYNDSTLEPKE